MMGRSNFKEMLRFDQTYNYYVNMTQFCKLNMISTGCLKASEPTLSG